MLLIYLRKCPVKTTTTTPAPSHSSGPVTSVVGRCYLLVRPSQGRTLFAALFEFLNVQRSSGSKEENCRRASLKVERERKGGKEASTTVVPGFAFGYFGHSRMWRACGGWVGVLLGDSSLSVLEMSDVVVALV